MVSKNNTENFTMFILPFGYLTILSAKWKPLFSGLFYFHQIFRKIADEIHFLNSFSFFLTSYLFVTYVNEWVISLWSTFFYFCSKLWNVEFVTKAWVRNSGNPIRENLAEGSNHLWTLAIDLLLLKLTLQLVAIKQNEAGNKI